MMGIRDRVTLLLCAAALAAGRLVAAEAPPPGPRPIELEFQEMVKKARCDNAAVQYLAACLELPPRKDREDKTGYFITTTLQASQPEAFKEYPEAAEAVAGYSRAVKLLRYGATMKECNFGENWSKGVGALMPDIGRLRDLARRALAYGMFLEREGKPAEAAETYLAVVRMGCHMGQNAAASKLLSGISIAGMGLGKIQSMLSRGVDESIARQIIDALREIPDRPFDVSGALHKDRLCCSTFSWRSFQDRLDAATAEEFEAELTAAVGMHNALGEWMAEMLGPDLKPGPGELLPQPKLPKDKAELRKLLAQWFDDFDASTKKLAGAAGEPYCKNHNEVKLLENALAEQGRKGNLILLLFPLPAASLQKSTARLEARLGATKLLAAACLVKAKTGQYPGTLDGLKNHFPKGLPVDPFTGKDPIYRLDDDLPVVEAQGDDPEIKKARPQTFVFSLAAIKKREAERIKRWPAEYEEHRKRMEEMDKQDVRPQPREKVEDVF